MNDNPGIIAPPPLLYLSALAAGFAISMFEPILSFPLPVRVSGLLIFVMSGIFARWSFVAMKKIGTSANPRKRSEALTTDGPFRFSRNPIYLAMTGLYVGIALLGNAFWPLIFLSPLLAVMHRGVILREERYLEREFGESYLAYKSKTSRWL
ncbi:MAG TPA: isoprenylcysteine carboxylmethyltransferase family protein [Burkholderiales bacterium]|nr:isoprenylcysteine carboxylmethyltransferase family protein [Burkholderiales bacterium]